MNSRGSLVLGIKKYKKGYLLKVKDYFIKVRSEG